MGLHIHVAPEGRGWTLKELQQIAVAIAHFHGPLRRVFPWHKYTEAYTKCNIAENLTLRDKTFEVIAKIIRDADTIDKLIWVMNPPPGNKFDSRSTITFSNFVHIKFKIDWGIPITTITVILKYKRIWIILILRN